MSSSATLQVGQDLAGGVLAGASRDAAAGMGAGAGEVQAFEVLGRQPVAGMPEERPPEVELVEAGLAVERVATGQPEAGFEIDRREHLAVGDQLADAGRDR